MSNKFLIFETCCSLNGDAAEYCTAVLALHGAVQWKTPSTVSLYFSEKNWETVQETYTLSRGSGEQKWKMLIKQINCLIPTKYQWTKNGMHLY